MEERTFREKLRLTIIISIYSAINLVLFLLLTPLCFALSPMLMRIFYGPVSIPIQKSEPLFITEIPYFVYDMDWLEEDHLLKIRSASTDEFRADEPYLITEFIIENGEIT